jgi:hypothetical protein
MYVYGTNGAPDVVAAARGLALGLADWGAMIAARFPVKADREVTPAARAHYNLIVVGAAPLNSFAPPWAPAPGATGKAAELGDRAYRAQVADPQAPSGYALVFGALTPRGFAKLQRFARPNKDAPAPEPNRAAVLLDP